MAGDVSIDIDSPDLRGLFEHVRQFDAGLAAELRRRLRRSGDEIIAAQRAVLAGAKPGSVRRVGTRIRRVTPKNRASYLAVRAVLETGADREGASSRLRQRIAQGLSTRVVTGSRRQSVLIRTSGPREGGYNLALLWEKRIWRHPVFGNRNAWVYQQGRPYFYDPIRDRVVKMQNDIADAVQTILDRIGNT